MDKTFSELMDIVNRSKKYDTGTSKPRPKKVEPVVEEEYTPKEYDLEEEKPKRKTTKSSSSTLSNSKLGALVEKTTKSTTKKTSTKSSTPSSTAKKTTTKKTPAKSTATKSTTKKTTEKNTSAKADKLSALMSKVSASKKENKPTKEETIEETTPVIEEKQTQEKTIKKELPKFELPASRPKVKPAKSVTDSEPTNDKDAQLYAALKDSLFKGGTDISEYLTANEEIEMSQQNYQNNRIKQEASKINDEISKEQQEYEQLFTGSLSSFYEAEEENTEDSYTRDEKNPHDSTYELDTGNRDLDKKIADYYKRKQQMIDKYNAEEEDYAEEKKTDEDKPVDYYDIFGGDVLSRDEVLGIKPEETLEENTSELTTEESNNTSTNEEVQSETTPVENENIDLSQSEDLEEENNTQSSESEITEVTNTPLESISTEETTVEENESNTPIEETTAPVVEKNTTPVIDDQTSENTFVQNNAEENIEANNNAEINSTSENTNADTIDNVQNSNTTTTNTNNEREEHLKSMLNSILYSKNTTENTISEETTASDEVPYSNFTGTVVEQTNNTESVSGDNFVMTPAEQPAGEIMEYSNQVPVDMASMTKLNNIVEPAEEKEEEQEKKSLLSAFVSTTSSQPIEEEDDDEELVIRLDNNEYATPSEDNIEEDNTEAENNELNSENNDIPNITFDSEDDESTENATSSESILEDNTSNEPVSEDISSNEPVLEETENNNNSYIHPMFDAHNTSLDDDNSIVVDSENTISSLELEESMQNNQENEPVVDNYNVNEETDTPVNSIVEENNYSFAETPVDEPTLVDNTPVSETTPIEETTPVDEPTLVNNTPVEESYTSINTTPVEETTWVDNTPVEDISNTESYDNVENIENEPVFENSQTTDSFYPTEETNNNSTYEEITNESTTPVENENTVLSQTENTDEDYSDNFNVSENISQETITDSTPVETETFNTDTEEDVTPTNDEISTPVEELDTSVEELDTSVETNNNSVEELTNNESISEVENIESEPVIEETFENEPVIEENIEDTQNTELNNEEDISVDNSIFTAESTQEPTISTEDESLLETYLSEDEHYDYIVTNERLFEESNRQQSTNNNEQITSQEEDDDEDNTIVMNNLPETRFDIFGSAQTTNNNPIVEETNQVEETHKENEESDTISKEEFYNEMARLQENLINELKGNKVETNSYDFFAEKPEPVVETPAPVTNVITNDDKANTVVDDMIAVAETENTPTTIVEQVLSKQENTNPTENNNQTAEETTQATVQPVAENIQQTVENNEVSTQEEHKEEDLVGSKAEPVDPADFDKYNLLNKTVALNEEDLKVETIETENKEPGDNYFYGSNEDKEKKANVVDEYMTLYNEEVHISKEVGDINIFKNIGNAVPSSEILKEEQTEQPTNNEKDEDGDLETIYTLMGIQRKTAAKAEKEIKVLYCASECQPFAASGGLADVAGSLPKTIASKGGVDIRVIMPLYGNIKSEYRDKFEYLGNFTVHLSWRQEYCGLFRYFKDGVTYYFIDNERYFKRNTLYGFYDDGERFAYFSKAIVEALPHLNFFPDIIHCNDWQTALVSSYVKTGNWSDHRYYKIRFIYTIHNVEYQGVYGMENLKDLFGIDPRFKNDLEYNGDINLTKAAIQYCDKLTTVSNSYCDNLKQPYCSRGLHHIIIRNEYKLSGIINGIDYDFYNPASDPNLFKNYDIGCIEEKVLNKKLWQEEIGLPVDGDTPMIAIVSRLVGHKGLDLIAKIIHNILQQDIQLVVVGTGEDRYVDLFKSLEHKYPTKVRAFVDKYSNEIARKAYAASDIFVMPSKIEPCGLSQMISSRYGSVPIVREVGGLKDTIKDFGCEGGGNGYTFANYNPNDLQYQIERAIKDYSNKTEWREKMKICMSQDYTWSKPAISYINLYKSISSN